MAGKKEDIYNDVTLRLEKLPIGKYILICESQSDSNCLLRIYSPTLITMSNFVGNSMILLEHTFFNMAQFDEKHQESLSSFPSDWYYSKSMFQELGFGFFLMTIG